MKFAYVPLLSVQREIQGLPRDYSRFQQYLRTVFDADGIAARAAAEASAALADVPGEFKIAVVGPEPLGRPGAGNARWAGGKVARADRKMI